MYTYAYTLINIHYDADIHVNTETDRHALITVSELQRPGVFEYTIIFTKFLSRDSSITTSSKTPSIEYR